MIPLSIGMRKGLINPFHTSLKNIEKKKQFCIKIFLYCRFKEIQNKLTPYLRKCGFNPKTDIIYIPVSGLTGAFLKDRPNSEFGSWYT